MEIRLVERKEIEKVREINRREVVEQLYYYKNGTLIIENEFIDDPGWTPAEVEEHVRDLYTVYDLGGSLYGAFDGDTMAGIGALGNKFIGSAKDQLQVTFLHVDADYRNRGIGKNLMKKIIECAKAQGVKKLYISATPSKNTIDFYLGLGCQLTTELIPELFELEPDDIHLQLIL
ncbi:MAG: GNAT family N-acetyltransferase [Candidatus Hodarchaeota archaeon]